MRVGRRSIIAVLLGLGLSCPDAEATDQVSLGHNGTIVVPSTFKGPSLRLQEPKVAIVNFKSTRLPLGARYTNAGRLMFCGSRVLVLNSAVGGLYDPDHAEGMFRQPLLASIRAQLVPITPNNLCAFIAAAQHKLPVLKGSNADTRETIAFVDGFGHYRPKVRKCERRGDVFVFDEVVGVDVDTPEPRFHVFGGIRFLGASRGSIQYVQVSDVAPDDGFLAEIATMLGTFRPKR